MKKIEADSQQKPEIQSDETNNTAKRATWIVINSIEFDNYRITTGNSTEKFIKFINLIGPELVYQMKIYFRVAFKSVATILMEQETVNMEGEDTILKARGRHDPCVLPRAVPIVESMTAMTLLDYLLIQKTRENF